MAVGMVLFWPALFFLEGGDGPEAAEYSRLKGEQEAVGRTIRKRDCDVEVAEFEPPAPPEPVPAVVTP